MARRGPRIPCPECKRPTSVVRSTGEMWRHVDGDVWCPGSGAVIDLYGERRE